MRESTYQAQVIRELKERFQGCVVLKNDSSYQQGIPDLLILFNNKWACLEVKPSQRASHQPNQDYWVTVLDDMSYAAFIFPDVHDEIMAELSTLFRNRRATVRINS